MASVPQSNSNGDDAVMAELRLSLVSGVGPLTRARLLEAFGSAENVLAAKVSELRQVEGVGAKIADAIKAARDDDREARKLFDYCREQAVAIITRGHPNYPRELLEIPDPPGVLFVRGQILPHDNLAIAIVGTRHATHYGREQAEHLAAGLSRAGLTIVSGLARGIDGIAHRAALAVGGRTIAVLGSGVMNVYPPDHEELAEQVIAAGALVSENPPHSPPLAGAFPQRNRIITGMSLGVIVVEASDRSGALISARHAMEQGREVYAVPGPVTSRMSRGCHRLIRDGAKLVENVDDVLEELGPLPAAVPREDGRGDMLNPAELQLNEQETQILLAIGVTPTSIDEVVAASGLPVHRVLATVSVLEMRKLVRRVSGNSVVRKS
jgi:DNA processing protein